MKDGLWIEYVEMLDQDGRETSLMMTLMSNYVPKVGEYLMIDEREFHVQKVEHIIKQKPEVKEKFVVLLDIFHPRNLF